MTLETGQPGVVYDTVGLLGGTGTLWIDSLTIEAEPRGGATTTNLVLNGGFELGDPEPAHWALEGGARRVSPGRDSDAALELASPEAKAITGIGVPVRRFGRLNVALSARGSGLRASGGAAEVRQLLFSLDGRDVDLRIAPAGEPGRFRVQGQVLGPDAAGMAAFHCGDAQGEAAWNELAEFGFDAVPAGTCRLLLRTAAWEAELPPIELAAQR